MKSVFVIALIISSLMLCGCFGQYFQNIGSVSIISVMALLSAPTMAAHPAKKKIRKIP